MHIKLTDEQKEQLWIVIGASIGPVFQRLWDDIETYWNRNTFGKLITPSNLYPDIADIIRKSGDEKHRARLSVSDGLIIDQYSLVFLNKLFRVAGFEDLGTGYQHIRTIKVYGD